MQKRPEIRILNILYVFNIGGLENGLINLINRSDPNIFHHEICCITTTGSAEQRLERSVKIFQMNKRKSNDWQMVCKLLKLIKNRRPHIVHTRNWGTVDGIVAARLANVPYVVH
ncbi:glycosyltransferase, partial [Thermodesulfobacteriota bacterium]